jgi:sec-independent protein translocase protein TatA
MFGISFEHLLIVGIILLVVGPRRLPELGNTMGKAIKNFKDSMSGIEEANYKRVTDDKNEKSASASTEKSVTADQDSDSSNKPQA